MAGVDRPPAPWSLFFGELERLLTEPIELHCFGGFVLIHCYGIERSTNDVDFISITPAPARRRVIELGGFESDLHRRFGVYLDPVTVATAPDEYESRLTPLFPGAWSKVSLYALEAHDVALAKLDRNFERDRDDVQRLARAGHLNRDVLQRRYVEELRPYLSRASWHDQTLRLWIEAFWPEAK
jgi:hypothetical protein